MTDVFSGGTPRVEDLIGEGKKYATPEKALESLPHKELLIAHLQEQVKGLSSELEKSKTLEEVLENLKKPAETPITPRQEPSGSQDLYKELEARLTSVLDNKVKEAVTTTVSATDEQRTRQMNRMAVSDALSSTYGATAAKVLADKATELGISVEDLGALSERSPKAVLAYFQIQGTGSSSGSVNTEALQHKGSGPREGTYAFYEQMRKSNPREYWKPKTQARIFEDRKRLGDAFNS